MKPLKCGEDMEHYEKFEYSKILKYYMNSGYYPLRPSLFTKKYGDFFCDLFKNVISNLGQSQTCVLLGYYTSNLNVEINEINSIFKRKEDAVDILTCNMLLFEFSYDLLNFSQYKDLPHFYSILEKYLELCIGKPDPILHDFFHKKQNKLFNHGEDNIENLYKVAAAAMFVVSHECVHLNRDLLKCTIDLFNSSTDFLSLLNGIGSNDIIECACDYSSLYFFTSNDLPLKKIMQDYFNCSSTDFLFCSMVMQIADYLFQMLVCCLKVKNFEIDFDKIRNQAYNRIKHRIKPMVIAMRFSENTKSMHLIDLNLSNALSKITDLIESFFKYIATGMKEIADYGIKNNQNNFYIELNEPIRMDNIWYLIR